MNSTTINATEGCYTLVYEIDKRIVAVSGSKKELNEVIEKVGEYQASAGCPIHFKILSLFTEDGFCGAEHIWEMLKEF